MWNIPRVGDTVVLVRPLVIPSEGRVIASGRLAQVTRQLCGLYEVHFVHEPTGVLRTVWSEYVKRLQRHTYLEKGAYNGNLL